MLDVLAITAPIYLLIGLGFGSVRLGYLAAEVIPALGLFVIRICIPALIFSAVTAAPGAALNPAFILGFGAASLTLFALGLAVMRLIRGKGLAASALFALGMANSNSGFMGYPIAALVIGAQAEPMLAWAMIVENMVLIPMAITVADLGAFPERNPLAAIGQALKGLLQNQIVLALAAALAFNAIGLTLPGIARDVLDYLVSTAPVVALFVVGGTVARFAPRPIDADIGLVTLGKLVLHPLLVFAALHWGLALDPVLVAGGVLFASVPMLSIFPIFGQRYGIESITAATLIAATTASFFTVTVLIWAIERL